MMFRAVFATILCLIVANCAQADGATTRIITKPDQAKLDKYEETMGKALEEARKGGTAADVKCWRKSLAKPHLPFQ